MGTVFVPKSVLRTVSIGTDFAPKGVHKCLNWNCAKPVPIETLVNTFGRKDGSNRDGSENTLGTKPVPIETLLVLFSDS